jgi:hypothetical protein
MTGFARFTDAPLPLRNYWGEIFGNQPIPEGVTSRYVRLLGLSPKAMEAFAAECQAFSEVHDRGDQTEIDAHIASLTMETVGPRAEMREVIAEIAGLLHSPVLCSNEHSAHSVASRIARIAREASVSCSGNTTAGPRERRSEPRSPALSDRP